MKIREETHKLLKTQASKHGLSMMEYLDKLLKEVEKNEKQ